jgi:Putative beta barrel porin-7 (BBP7)
MKWFRKTFLWASLGCLGATASASGQTNWRATAVPLADDPAQIRVVRAGNGVTLETPRPIPAESMRVVNTFVPMETPAAVRQASYAHLPPPSVVRGTAPTDGDAPKSLALPKEQAAIPEILVGEPYQPAKVVQPPPKDKAKIIEVDKTPNSPTPIPTNPNEHIIVIDNGHMIDDQGRSLFGFNHVGVGQFYGSAEYLLWSTRGYHLPPLVTTASPLDPEATRGALGFGTTQIIFGDSDTAGGLRSGARVTLGYSCDPCGLWSIEGNFFFLARKNDGAAFNSNDFPVLGRPFFNINTGTQDRQLTTSPGIVPGDVFDGVGTLTVRSSSSLYGAELNGRALLWACCNFEVSGIVGFRYLNLSDNLSITENITSLRDIPGVPPNPPISRAGDQIVVFDQFNTRNVFYGGQVGLNGEWRVGPWSLDATAKLAIGVTQQSVDIDGFQRITSVDGRVQNFQGGLYALSSNIGTHTQSRFGVVPELGFKFGYNFTDNIRVFVGYDFLYWSSVVRPGDQIDQSLNANIIPNSGAPFPATTQVHPVVPFRTTSYWAMGVNAGLEFRY